jgi:hypothetical protein
MGRTTFGSFVPRLYLVEPILLPIDISSTLKYGTFTNPYYNADYMAVADRKGRPIALDKLGLTYHVETMTNDDTSKLEIGTAAVAGRQEWLQNAGVDSEIAPATGSNARGTIYTEETLDDAGVNLKRSCAGEHTVAARLRGNNWSFTLNVSDAFEGFSAMVIYAPSCYSNDGASAAIPIGASAATHFPGPVAGGYVEIPFIANNAASGLGTWTTVRQVVAPFAMRAQYLELTSQVSGASNEVRIYNITKSVAIASDTSVVGATRDFALKAASDLSNRNISKGDVLALQVKTSGTGYTYVAAKLLAHTRGHFSPHARHDTVAAGAPLTVPVSAYRTIRSTMSGPVAGGMCWLYIPPGNAAADTAWDDVSQITVPFNCELLCVRAFGVTQDALSEVRVYNTTQTGTYDGLAVSTGGNNAYVTRTQSDMSGNGTLATMNIAKGDVITLQHNTTGQGVSTQASAAILVRVTGHVNTLPRND